MKKLLLLLIIPFLSFGQDECPDECLYWDGSCIEDIGCPCSDEMGIVNQYTSILPGTIWRVINPGGCSVCNYDPTEPFSMVFNDDGSATDNHGGIWSWDSNCYGWPYHFWLSASDLAVEANSCDNQFIGGFTENFQSISLDHTGFPDFGTSNLHLEMCNDLNNNNICDSDETQCEPDTYWISDFSDESDWVINCDNSDGCFLNWQIGENLECQGMSPIGPINSNDGFYAMIDGDYYGNQEGGMYLCNSWITISDPVTTEPCCWFGDNVVVEFNTYIKGGYFGDDVKCFLLVSNNGEFPTNLSLESGNDPENGIYEILSDFTSEANAESPNPHNKKINISTYAEGENQIWIRFHWTSFWGYAWFIDDVGIKNINDNTGCTYLGACNYNSTASIDDGSCEYPNLYYDCDDNCINDMDDDDVCDEFDNCIEYYNPNQEDFDSDDIGDACDGIGLDKESIPTKIIKTIDILVRENTTKGFQLHIYDDGSVEKKYLIK